MWFFGFVGLSWFSVPQTRTSPDNSAFSGSVIRDSKRGRYASSGEKGQILSFVDHGGELVDFGLDLPVGIEDLLGGC